MQEEILPGMFIEVDVSNPRVPIKQQKPKLEYSQSCIVAYECFKREFYNPQSVLFTSCGFDASPAKVFNKVTFVDLEKGNKGCIALLRKKGYQAFKEDIREYKPREQHDLLLIQNPSAPVEWAIPHLKREGYIIANNYHGSASWLHNQSSQFDFISAIEMDTGRLKSRKFQARMVEDLTGYFEPVRNEQELKEWRPAYYKILQQEIESLAMNIEGFPKKNQSFKERWDAYRRETREGMPSKCVADHYVFRKK